MEMVAADLRIASPSNKEQGQEEELDLQLKNSLEVAFLET